MIWEQNQKTESLFVRIGEHNLGAESSRAEVLLQKEVLAPSM